jgi:hypothetical protein
MKRALTRQVPLLVPMLTAALIVVGWGVASAGPCVPDGQTCRTDQSCCSGVCVKEAKKSFGTCNIIQCCVQDTCILETPAQCAAAGGISQGLGSCSPNPCVIQCCVQSSPMGAFDICLLETPAQCAAQGGIDRGSGTCSPNPCLPGCFPPCGSGVGCGTCGNGLCASPLSNTCGIHHFPNPVCIAISGCRSSTCDPFSPSGDASCPPGQACAFVGGPACCPACF